LTKANQIDGETPYISSTALNNGVDNFIGNTENIRKSDHDLTLANSGSVGACFYHDYEYIASDHVTSLKLPNGNDTVYKFISVILGRLEERYSFNREINDTRIKREKLLLPMDKNGDPNRAYMENFIKNIEQKQIKNILKYLDKYIYIINDHFDKVEWKEFFLDEICNINSGVRLTKANMNEGKIPFIGATDSNNGITNFVSNTNASFDKNVLGVNYNGSVVENFYHPYSCIFSDDVKRVSFKDKEGQNKYCYLFLKQMILQQKEKYRYAYKFNGDRMARQKIMMPVDDNSRIDYRAIKNYMKAKELKLVVNGILKNLT
jgi:restriction enzyme bgcI subunit beta